MNKKITYNKLVRDRIPEIVSSNGHKPRIRELRANEFKQALKAKIIEEADELSKARNEQDIYKELGDLEEVISALKKELKISSQKLQKIKSKRRKDRGGFSKKIFLMEVIEYHE